MKIDLINHKGTVCIKRENLLCQEGYCSGCAIGATKRIAVDLDGAVCEYDFPGLVLRYYGVKIPVENIFAYDLCDVLGVSYETLSNMFKEQVWGPPHYVDGSRGVLEEWHDKGYEIIIYSNRTKYMSPRDLALWLINNKIPFKGIDVPGSGEYDFHIDDSPAKLASTNSRIKLLYDQPWNRRCLDIHKKFTRVTNWEEVNKYVSQM